MGSVPLRHPRRVQRTLPAALCALLLTSALTACGGSPDPDPPPLAAEQTGAAITGVEPPPLEPPATVTPMATPPLPQAPAADPTQEPPPAASAPTSTPEPEEPAPPPADEAAAEPAASLPAVPPPGPFTAIGVAGQQACAWTAADEQVCWGKEDVGQWSKYSQFEARAASPCFVTQGGETACLVARLPEDLPPGRYTAVSQLEGRGWRERQRWNDGCALTDTGAVACWGLFATLEDAPLERYTAIRVGVYITRGGGGRIVNRGACGLTAAGALHCWGIHSSRADSHEPYADYHPGPYVAVDTRDGRSFCAVTAAGAVTDVRGGDCGFGASDGAPPYTAISLGRNHNCALTAAGAAACVTAPSAFWTAGAVTTMTPPDPAPGRYVALSVGDGYGCALTAAGEAVCWQEEAVTVDPPDPAPGRYVALSTGWGHGCALTEAGEAVCWGWNNFGQVDVPPGRYMAISAGAGGTCALTAAGEVVCWGGTLGDAAVDLPPGPYRDISVGAGYGIGSSTVCVLTAAGDAVCFGYLEETPPGPFVAISAGAATVGGFEDTWPPHACALTAAGEVVCWGGNAEGQTTVPPGRYAAIHASAGGTCALTVAGDAICWGKPIDEVLRGMAWGGTDLAGVGDGPYTAISVSANISLGTSNRACALTEVGTVVCWGTHWMRIDGVRVPRPPPPPGRYAAISLSSWYDGGQDCALSTAGALVCWGDPSYGNPPGMWFY